MLATPRVSARFVAHKVVRDCEQPCALVRQRLLPKRADERLLRYLFCPVAITKPSCEVAHEMRVVRSKKPLDMLIVQSVTMRKRSP